MSRRRFAWAFSAASALVTTLSCPLLHLSAQPPIPGVNLRVIVVASTAEANRALARIKAGEPFESVARAVSIDGSAPEGGLLGKVELISLRADIRQAVQDLAPGNVAGPLQIPTGVALLQVVREVAPGQAAAKSAALVAMASAGSVKYVADIGGLPEAEALLREFSKPAGWNQSPRAICQARQDSLEAGVQLFDRFFSEGAASFRAGRTPFEVMQANLGLAQLLTYQGLMSRALDRFDQAFELARTASPASLPIANEMIGVAYLHKASMDNGVMRAPDDMCLLPPPAGRSYGNTADLDKAIAHFDAALAQKPDDLEVRWLLNVAYMLKGKYPDGVPAAIRIAPSAFASGDDVGRFTDVAKDAGLNVFASAGGVIVDDFAGNGRFDVVTSNFYSCGPLHYFGNNGDGTFTERTSAAGLRDQLGGLNIVQADYNNDRCTDILVLRGGWEIGQRKSLLKNNCDGTFTDVTVQSGLATPITATQTAAWADIDNDGWLDLFVGNEDGPSQLFLNKRDGTFEDISRSAKIDRNTFAKAVVAGDYDNDGFVDFYVSNYDGTNLLYHNEHNRTFTERAQQAGAPGPGRGFAAWFFDYDNDGWLDLFATSYFMSVDESARTYLGLPHNGTTLKLYHNQHDGTFRDVTREAGLDKVFMPMGSNFGDIDNDGYPDIYLGMGSPSLAAVLPHVLLHNREGKSFVDVTTSSGTGEMHKGHGVAFVDLDNDGDEDIVAEIGGATPADSHAMRVFENPGHGNDWLSVRLNGVTSNRSAIGARIAVTLDNEGRGRRTVYRTVGSGGSFGASPLEQHLGLGRSARIIDLDIWWPATGIHQHFNDVTKNQAIEVTEGVPTVRHLERPVVRLGGAQRP
jgi:tetratricopeptide (TPR) repeat protein